MSLDTYFERVYPTMLLFKEFSENEITNINYKLAEEIDPHMIQFFTLFKKGLALSLLLITCIMKREQNKKIYKQIMIKYDENEGTVLELLEFLVKEQLMLEQSYIETSNLIMINRNQNVELVKIGERL